jgi:transposase InsO family protein
MKLREEFVLKALEPNACMSEVCREYGVSRQNGYKWVKRFKEEGLEGLVERSRRPHGSPLNTSGEMVLQILEMRGEYGWGPKKLRQLLTKRLRGEEPPRLRTIARILARAGMAKKRRRRPAAKVWAEGAPHPTVNAPNDLWTVDFKGWWKTDDGQRCEPLTVRDAYSRFVLRVAIVDSTSVGHVRKEFQRLFEKYGLPKAILSDNGNPFACTRALANLSELSAWWVSLEIQVIHSRPGCPQDNGGHERVHVDMLPLQEQSAPTRKAQQVLCEKWQREFNHIRPHEALQMRTPAEVYKRSSRSLPAVATAKYPAGSLLRRVKGNGCFYWKQRDVFVSHSLRTQTIALISGVERRAKVLFHQIVLGDFDLETGHRVEPICVSSSHPSKPIAVPNAVT